MTLQGTPRERLIELSHEFNNVQWRGEDSFFCNCTSHDDKKASLEISLGNNDNIVFHCFAGCSTEKILASKGLTFRDISSEKERTNVTKKHTWGKQIACYDYINTTGQVKLRKYKYVDEEGNKNFPWQRYENGKWQWGLNGLTANIYGLNSVKDDDTILFTVEGEKDQQTISELGFPCVTLPNGGSQKSWDSAYDEPFRDRFVYILGDNDETGRGYQEFIATHVHTIAKKVYILNLSQEWTDIPQKADITDFFQAYGKERTLQAIERLCTNSPEWTPFEAEEEDVFSSFGFYTVPDLTEAERKPPEFIIDGMLPVGMSFLSGAPKIRKSFLALQIAIAVASGGQFFGHDTVKCDVVYLDLEGSKSRISSRTQRMTTAIPSNVFVTNKTPERLSNGLTEKLQALHKQKPSIRLIIIDTYSRARGSPKTFGQNAYDADVSFLEPVQQMALQENIAILFVHHDKKGAGFASDSFERLSGTMGISGSADAVLNLIAEGKRFEGKAKLEYTPRDAIGGEMNLVFSDRYTEWQTYEKPPSDLMGNPVCKWILDNVPDPKREGQFFSYDAVFKGAYGMYSESPGDKIREQIALYRDELFSDYNTAIQIGIKSNGQRGIRLINLV